METKINLGTVPVVERMGCWRGGNKVATYSLSVKEVAVDLETATAESLFAEAADRDKTELALKTADLTCIDRLMGLYLIGPESGYPVKIGISDTVKARLSALQTGSWEKVKLHALLWLFGYDAYGVEQAVLKEAKRIGCHERGEWLSLTPVSAMDMVIDAARAEGVRVFTSAMAVENQGRALMHLDRASRMCGNGIF